MKTEVFTCDRCGKTMEKPKSFNFFYSTTSLRFESFEACMATKDSSMTKIRDKLQNMADDSSVRVTVDVDGYFKSRSEDYELCKDCKKQLMKFLKGGRLC